MTALSPPAAARDFLIAPTGGGERIRPGKLRQRLRIEVVRRPRVLRDLAFGEKKPGTTNKC